MVRPQGTHRKQTYPEMIVVTMRTLKDRHQRNRRQGLDLLHLKHDHAIDCTCEESYQSRRLPMDFEVRKQDDDCSQHGSPVMRHRLMLKQQLIGLNVIPCVALHPKHEQAIDCTYQTLNPKPKGESSPEFVVRERLLLVPGACEETAAGLQGRLAGAVAFGLTRAMAKAQL